ncbi:hypothetical protein KY289_035983 [Solanum tuberosum]|nr:hypothetical protein KY289_035983 [Solanum tuberosum]
MSRGDGRGLGAVALIQGLTSHETKGTSRTPSRIVVKTTGLKHKPECSVDRYKTHLVAKAFTKHPGLDYHSTFSPVVKPAIVRLVLTIATQLYWHADQLDVNNAFLQGLPTEVVYMRQPPGFGNSGSPTHVCYLQKAIYGLK